MEDKRITAKEILAKIDIDVDQMAQKVAICCRKEGEDSSYVSSAPFIPGFLLPGRITSSLTSQDFCELAKFLSVTY